MNTEQTPKKAFETDTNFFVEVGVESYNVLGNNTRFVYATSIERDRMDVRAASLNAVKKSSKKFRPGSRVEVWTFHHGSGKSGALSQGVVDKVTPGCVTLKDGTKWDAVTGSSWATKDALFLCASGSWIVLKV